MFFFRISDIFSLILHDSNNYYFKIQYFYYGKKCIAVGESRLSAQIA